MEVVQVSGRVLLINTISLLKARMRVVQMLLK